MTTTPESQMDDCNVICPYCQSCYHAECSDYSDAERKETCEACGKSWLRNDEITVTHHTSAVN